MNGNFDRARSLAKVSQIALGEEELNIIERRLRDVETIFRDLDCVDVENYRPMDRACDEANVLRLRETPSAAQACDIMKNAPETQKGCFVTPRVVE